MSRTTWPALLLLTCACAHQSSGESFPVNKPAPIRHGDDPGRLSVVPVQPAQEGPGQRDAARPSMALDAETHGRASPELAPRGASKPQTAEETESELRLRERIQAELGRRASLSYTAQRVSVAVKRRNVVLSGDVRTEREKGEVQKIVESIDGVRRVTNQLAVIDQPQPVEPSVH